jgi:hypothetical protein
MTMRKTGGKVPSALDGFRCAGLWAGRMPRHRGLRETWFKGNPLAHRAFAQTTLALPSQVGGPFRASLDAYLFFTRLPGVSQRIFFGNKLDNYLIIKAFLIHKPPVILGFLGALSDKDHHHLRNDLMRPPAPETSAFLLSLGGT